MMRFPLYLALLAGCVTPGSTFVCETSAECSGGTCEPDTGFCSFADPGCETGRRYGDGSGSLSGTCVGGGTGDSVCGDGMVTGSEECEDGNTIDTDFCVGCKFAKCGDGKILAGVEECDDTNAADGDGCNANCLMCPAGSVTNPANNHCYWLVETLTDWDVAADACIANGGYLASINDSAENAFVTSILVNTNYWIGLEFSNGSANFRWEDDDVLGTFQGWAPGQPVAGTEDCANILTAGTWVNEACTVLHPFVCEREPSFVNATTKHVYRRFGGEGRKTYTDATTTCAGLTPAHHVATFNDQAEQDYIHSIIRATGTWVGMDDVVTDGTFILITGETATFFNWASTPTQEPDAVNALAEDNVVMREDGFWETTTNTGFGRSFVCELDAP